MSELGKTLDDLNRLGNREKILSTRVVKPLGIKTPLEKGKSNGETLFKMHFDIKDQVMDNLKNLIMTQKGERLGFPDFGTTLREIYSDASSSQEQIIDKASSQIKNVVSKYIPNISLINFYSELLDDNNEVFDEANVAAYQLLNSQAQVNFNDPLRNKDNISELNKKNPNIDSIYKITIEYKIPILENFNQTLVLFINTSK